jgi:hypothetical protein
MLSPYFTLSRALQREEADDKYAGLVSHLFSFCFPHVKGQNENIVQVATIQKNQMPAVKSMIFVLDTRCGLASYARQIIFAEEPPCT